MFDSLLNINILGSLFNMLIDEIFDKDGIDGIDNKAAFERLPVVLKYFVETQQKLLCNKVKNRVLSEYGQEGLNSLCKTSGFRAHRTNLRYGGVADSLHLFGCAADFLKTGIFKDKPIPVCCNLEVIDSGKCWHVQFKRG